MVLCVIASQSSDWRGNPRKYPECLGDRHTSVRNDRKNEGTL